MSHSTNKNSINSRKLFTMKLSPEEQTTYDELVETHRFGTLADLIRACLNAAKKDPSILDPTADASLRGVSGEEFELLSVVNSSTEILQSLVEKANAEIEKNRRLSEGILKRQGASQFDIHALLEGMDQMSIAPNLTYFDEFGQWLRLQGKADRTISAYLYALAQIPDDIESFFANPTLKARQMKTFAYKNYLWFLCKRKKELGRLELIDLLDSYLMPNKKGNGISKSRWSVPKKQWEEYIRHAPNQVSKMGIWLGFQFGLRLGAVFRFLYLPNSDKLKRIWKTRVLRLPPTEEDVLEYLGAARKVSEKFDKDQST